MRNPSANRRRLRHGLEPVALSSPLFRTDCGEDQEMAGPTASLLLPALSSEERRTRIRREVERNANLLDGDDFWVEGRPFILSFGEEYEGELNDIIEAGLPSVLGWRPQDLLRLAAMCNDPVDHRILAQLLLRLAQILGGVIDFGGSVLPEPSLDGPTPSLPARVEAPAGLAGVVFATSYAIEAGRYGTCQYGDPAFLEAWLQHSTFRMVK